MSEVWWAGVAIDPDTQGQAAADELDTQIEEMLIGHDVSRDPYTTIIERDGSEIRRYCFGSIVMSDIRDRTGRRIGFGVQASGEDDARMHVPKVQTLFVSRGVDALASIWWWSRMEIRHPAPREMAFA